MAQGSPAAFWHDRGALEVYDLAFETEYFSRFNLVIAHEMVHSIQSSHPGTVLMFGLVNCGWENPYVDEVGTVEGLGYLLFEFNWDSCCGLDPWEFGDRGATEAMAQAVARRIVDPHTGDADRDNMDVVMDVLQGRIKWFEAIWEYRCKECQEN